ncbi:MAG: restriction endonuclease subunit R, partial [Chloroflexia bacterium]|nr:restriction endonuclease subunit R [Chloroflexia bacterium]
DMIATGTDVKPIEIVMFMRTVKSSGYFEQMKGRGVRVMPADDLRRVTSDAPAKTHFVIVDAVGVTETDMIDSPPPLERKRSVPFSKLIEQVAWGDDDPATLSSLAYRLSKLDKVLTDAQQDQIAVVSGGTSLTQIVRHLVRASDSDAHLDRAREVAHLPPDAMPDEGQIASARNELVEAATVPIGSNVELRNALIAMQARSEQVIDTVSQDEVLSAGFSAEATERNRALTRDFRRYIEEHRDEITALQILYNRPYGAQLHFQHLKELAVAIEAPPRSWTTDALWRAYEQLDRSRVRGTGRRVLTDLVSLVRFAIERDDELAPFRERVNTRFDAWLSAQETNGRRFSAEQRRWLELIRDHIASSYAIEREDFDDVPFSQHGGLGRLYDLFGDDYTQILADLNQALAA